MQRYFKVLRPSIHNMIVTLEKRGFIKHTPGASRSFQLLPGRDQLPDLQ
jgi:repressor LexA